MANEILKIDVYFSLLVSSIMFIISYSLYLVGFEFEFKTISLMFFILGNMVSISLGYLMKRNRNKKEP